MRNRSPKTAEEIVQQVRQEARANVIAGQAALDRAREELAHVTATRPITPPAVPSDAIPVDNTAEIIAYVKEQEAKGRHLAAALGLATLRERVADATAWRAFIQMNFPFSPARVQALLGFMVHRNAMYRCRDCGKPVVCECGCGAPLLPERLSPVVTVITEPPTVEEPPTALERAVAAVAANPSKSNVLIAKEIGVNERTVRRAREHAEVDAEVDVRTGADGKTRRLPGKAEPEVELPLVPKAKRRPTMDPNDLIRARLEFEAAWNAHAKTVIPSCDKDDRNAIWQAMDAASKGQTEISQLLMT
jgi:hypothetical protein